jgi:hypothetical protein
MSIGPIGRTIVSWCLETKGCHPCAEEECLYYYDYPGSGGSYHSRSVSIPGGSFVLLHYLLGGHLSPGDTMYYDESAVSGLAVPASGPALGGSSGIGVTVGGEPSGSHPGSTYISGKSTAAVYTGTVYLGYINPDECCFNQEYENDFYTLVTSWTEETGTLPSGGGRVCLDSANAAAYAANDWKTDPVGGVQYDIQHP